MWPWTSLEDRERPTPGRTFWEPPAKPTAFFHSSFDFDWISQRFCSRLTTWHHYWPDFFLAACVCGCFLPIHWWTNEPESRTKWRSLLVSCLQLERTPKSLVTLFDRNTKNIKMYWKQKQFDIFCELCFKHDDETGLDKHKTTRTSWIFPGSHRGLVGSHF